MTGQAIFRERDGKRRISRQERAGTLRQLGLEPPAAIMRLPPAQRAPLPPGTGGHRVR